MLSVKLVGHLLTGIYLICDLWLEKEFSLWVGFCYLAGNQMAGECWSPVCRQEKQYSDSDDCDSRDDNKYGIEER